MNTEVSIDSVKTPTTTLSSLQHRLAEVAKRGRGCTYPPSLKIAIATYCYKTVVQQGASWLSVHRDLGIACDTLKKWTRLEFKETRKGFGKSQEAVIETNPQVSELKAALDGVITNLVTPQGFIIENIPLGIALMLVNSEHPWKISAEVHVKHIPKALPEPAETH